MGLLPLLSSPSAWLTLTVFGCYCSSSSIHAFTIHRVGNSLPVPPRRAINNNRMSHSGDSSSRTVLKAKVGLITFDLDDTLYPIEPVIAEANRAFAAALLQYGFDGIQPENIDSSCREIRTEISQRDGPEAAAVLTHTEINTLAIQREMEKNIFQRKLAEAAEDLQQPLGDLPATVVTNAQKWSKEATSPSVVEAVMTAWEMERHHAAERHLFLECQDVLEQIRKEHPRVLIGAVTDGKANPLFMRFTLAKYFDFCLSWEDDQGSRSKFFKDLSSVEGNAELKWIYNAALEKYLDLSEAKAGLLKQDEQPQEPVEFAGGNPLEILKNNDEIWIHVGDDLAYDVGGSAQCGAKTIHLKLDRAKYQQTTRFKFDDVAISPGDIELQQHQAMNEAAKPLVDKTVEFLTRLPEAIQDIVEESSYQP